MSEGLCDGVSVRDGLCAGLGAADWVSEGVSVGVGEELGVKLCEAVLLWLRDCVPLWLAVLLDVPDDVDGVTDRDRVDVRERFCERVLLIDALCEGVVADEGLWEVVIACEPDPDWDWLAEIVAERDRVDVRDGDVVIDGVCERVTEEELACVGVEERDGVGMDVAVLVDESVGVADGVVSCKTAGDGRTVLRCQANNVRRRMQPHLRRGHSGRQPRSYGRGCRNSLGWRRRGAHGRRRAPCRRQGLCP